MLAPPGPAAFLLASHSASMGLVMMGCGLLFVPSVMYLPGSSPLWEVVRFTGHLAAGPMVPVLLRDGAFSVLAACGFFHLLSPACLLFMPHQLHASRWFRAAFFLYVFMAVLCWCGFGLASYIVHAP